MSAPGAPRRCPLCDREPRGVLRLSNGARLWRCPGCSLGWWRWRAFDAQRFYDRDYFQCGAARRGYADYAALERGLRRTGRARLRRIGRLLGGAGGRGWGRLFEVGCATGCFLEEARRRGWEVAGCEASAYAAGEAARRGLAVACGPIEELELPDGGFDCIVLWDVIEHLRDPAGALAKAARALRPGGLLALTTGDVTSLCARWSAARWHLFNLPEHLFFFSPLALRKLVSRSGCRLLRMTREISWVPLSYALERLLGAGRRRAVVPRALDRLIPATLLDVLGVYAVRDGPRGRQASCRGSRRGI